MVQLTHVYRVGTNDPFPDLQSPPRGSHMCANKALFEPEKPQNAINVVQIPFYLW